MRLGLNFSHTYPGQQAIVRQLTPFSPAQRESLALPPFNSFKIDFFNFFMYRVQLYVSKTDENFG
jgi:hypothetical protein